MKKIIILIIFFALPASATKGLLTDTALDPINSNSSSDIPNPKVGEIVDINLLDRTNQEMKLTSLNATQAVFDESDVFANTLRVNYQDNKTIKVRVREFMGTIIILPDNDQIKFHKVGDPDNFSFDPAFTSDDSELPSIGTANVSLAGADTSLHIIGTSGNVYSFYLRGDTWNSKHNPTMKVILTDTQLTAKLDAKKRREEIQKQKDDVKRLANDNASKELEEPDYIERVGFDPSKIDFGYRINGGKESLKPFMVYDDGYFTYFRFADGNSVANVTSFPAIYRVADGSDIPVNTSPDGSTLRAEGIANNWTLRLGGDHLCIEKMIKTPDVNSSMNVIAKDNGA